MADKIACRMLFIRGMVLLLCLTAAAMTCAGAVSIDSTLLQAEMEYLKCMPYDEAGDVYLHVLAQSTARTRDCCVDEHHDRKTPKDKDRDEDKHNKTCQPVTCAAWQGVLSSVEKAIRTDNFTVKGSSNGYYGCKNVQCDTNMKGTSICLNPITYIRVLEFGHEEASNCKAGASAAIKEFVGNLANSCHERLCTIYDYAPLRPTKSGCQPLG